MSAASAPSPPLPRAIALRFPAVESDWAYGALLAVALTWVAITANGGLRVGDTTTVEIVVDLVAGAVVAVAALTLSAARRHLPGTAAAGLFAVFVVASAISTLWSVAPDQSWIEANRMFTYLAAFAVGLAFVRLAPQRWPALLIGVTLAAVALSAWALLHKVFPGWLQEEETYARLREPFGYWNAVGITAALGVPGLLWLGARRTGHPVVSALATPAIGVLLVVLMLSYSRGALLALLVGCSFWFATVPLRLRAAAVLAPAVIGAGLVIAWTFSQVALTADDVPLGLRDQAGLQLGIAVLFMVLALAVAGLAVGFLRDRRERPAAQRRQAGIAVLAALALIPAAGIVGLATSERGLTGSIAHGWTQLTDPNASQPTNEPGRLTAVGSVRARYWNDALKVFEERPWLGVGVGGYQLARLRHRTDTLDVLHAHGYVVQVLADRGLVGVALSLAALLAVLYAIALATGLRGRRRRDTTPERAGLLTLATLVVVLGVHSFVDWTWFVPGVAIPVLLVGGWLAGRGPLDLPPRAPTALRERLRAGLADRRRIFAATGAVAIAIAAAWAAWQPQRALDATDAALAALEAEPPAVGTARKRASSAQRHNPLAVEPYLAQARIERTAGNPEGAERALQRAVQLQPANPGTWTALAEFQLREQQDPAAAKKTLSAALYLDPKSVTAIQLLLETNRALL